MSKFRAGAAAAAAFLGVVWDSAVFVAAVAAVTLLYYLAPLRRLVLRLPSHPVSKRLQLVALYLEVPIVRRAVVLWGVADVFPGFLRELSRGALRTTAFGMQPGVARAPFCFVPSLDFDASRAKLPPAVTGLAAHTETIAAELASLLERGIPFEEFFGTWRFFAFWEYGKRFPEHLEQAPRTASLLAAVPTLLRNSQCGFSLLPAEDSIGPHCDAHATNLRLRVHLGLLNCDPAAQSLSVGQLPPQHWRRGELLVLDTTFQHRAANRLSQDRVVLLFDVWHPALAARDLAALQRLDAFFDH